MKTHLQKLAVRILCNHVKSLKSASMLWNWIGYRENPEPLWSVMQKKVPWAFRNPENPNTMKFRY